MPFDLLPKDIIIPERCPVLDIPIASRLGLGVAKGSKDTSPSIDRIDNNKGYVRGNVIVVSYRVNRIKSDASLEELRRIVSFYERLSGATGGPGSQCSLSAVGGESGSVSPMLTSASQKSESLPVGEI